MLQAVMDWKGRDPGIGDQRWFRGFGKFSSAPEKYCPGPGKKCRELLVGGENF